MTPSKACKQAGLVSLRELSRISGQSDQTLTNWYHNKRQLFDLVLLGAAVRLAMAGDPTKESPGVNEILGRINDLAL